MGSRGYKGDRGDGQYPLRTVYDNDYGWGALGHGALGETATNPIVKTLMKAFDNALPHKIAQRIFAEAYQGADWWRAVRPMLTIQPHKNSRFYFDHERHKDRITGAWDGYDYLRGQYPYASILREDKYAYGRR